MYLDASLLHHSQSPLVCKRPQKIPSLCKENDMNCKFREVRSKYKASYSMHTVLVKLLVAILGHSINQAILEIHQRRKQVRICEINNSQIVNA